MQDVALTPSPTTSGKLTFRWRNGDLVFDPKLTYAVLSAVVCHKNGYRWNADHGTLLYRVKTDNRLTGSQLSNYASDGGRQLKEQGLLMSLTPRAERQRVGRWRLILRWALPGKTTGEQEVSL